MGRSKRQRKKLRSREPGLGVRQDRPRGRTEADRAARTAAGHADTPAVEASGFERAREVAVGVDARHLPHAATALSHGEVEERDRGQQQLRQERHHGEHKEKVDRNVGVESPKLGSETIEGLGDVHRPCRR